MYTETNDPKLILYSICIAAIYYVLLRMNWAFLTKVENVRIVGEEDFKKIQINSDYQRKKEKQWISLLHHKYLPIAFQEIHIRTTNKKCKNKMLPSKLECKSIKVYPEIRRESCEKSTQEQMQDTQYFS